MNRECKKHGLTAFSSSNRCRKCNVEFVTQKRHENRQKALSLKGRKCSKCGYDRCIEALEFHHLDSKEKDFGLSGNGMTTSWVRILKELEKCILVCANCHREIHASIAQW